MYKYLIIILFISVSLNHTTNNKKHQNFKRNSVEIWENEKIENPELKKEMIKLNKEFQNRRDSIKNEFKEKIKPLKIQKNKDISNLKDEYLDKRKLLFEKYGYKKEHKLKKNKRKKIGNKPLPFYKKHKPIPTK